MLTTFSLAGHRLEMRSRLVTAKDEEAPEKAREILKSHRIHVINFYVAVNDGGDRAIAVCAETY